MKKNKIINSRRITRHRQTCRQRLVDKNVWNHYVYQAGECALHGG